jgi:3-isopropylmalate/(R)-2-methylmalate dehydratase large subunit
MGSRTSKVYLSNSAVAAASAISGYITNPTSL